jgi:hypothetical protein
LSESLDHFPRHSRQTDVNSTPVPKDIVVCVGGGKKKNRANCKYCCKMWPQTSVLCAPDLICEIILLFTGSLRA